MNVRSNSKTWCLAAAFLVAGCGSNDAAPQPTDDTIHITTADFCNEGVIAHVDAVVTSLASNGKSLFVVTENSAPQKPTALSAGALHEIDRNGSHRKLLDADDVDSAIVALPDGVAFFRDELANGLASRRSSVNAMRAGRSETLDSVADDGAALGPLAASGDTFAWYRWPSSSGDSKGQPTISRVIASAAPASENIDPNATVGFGMTTSLTIDHTEAYGVYSTKDATFAGRLAPASDGSKALSMTAQSPFQALSVDDLYFVYTTIDPAGGDIWSVRKDGSTPPVDLVRLDIGSEAAKSLTTAFYNHSVYVVVLEDDGPHVRRYPEDGSGFGGETLLATAVTKISADACGITWVGPDADPSHSVITRMAR